MPWWLAMHMTQSTVSVLVSQLFEPRLLLSPRERVVMFITDNPPHSSYLIHLKTWNKWSIEKGMRWLHTKSLFESAWCTTVLSDNVENDISGPLAALNRIVCHWSTKQIVLSPIRTISWACVKALEHSKTYISGGKWFWFGCICILLFGIEKVCFIKCTHYYYYRAKINLIKPEFRYGLVRSSNHRVRAKYFYVLHVLDWSQHCVHLHACSSWFSVFSISERLCW